MSGFSIASELLESFTTPAAAAAGAAVTAATSASRNTPTNTNGRNIGLDPPRMRTASSPLIYYNTVNPIFNFKNEE